MTKTEILKQARKENRTQLTEIESKELIKQAGIPVVEARLAQTKTEAISLSKKMGFPVALKIVSPNIIHKSDCGGVKLNLKTTMQVGKAYDDIMHSVSKAYPDARISGVSVQTMARPGAEVIIGVSKDEQFGPVIMFGLGGVWVEVMQDVSFRVIPITRLDAAEMIKEIKGYKLLTGFRGQPAVDIAELEKMLVMVSRFVEAKPQVKEIDLNPIFTATFLYSINSSGVI